MTTAQDHDTGDASAGAVRVEAARYALLRRLAPSMRHHLVVHLQPIGMIYEVMERRLRLPQPRLAEVQESAQKINTFARAALHASIDAVTWLAPEEGRAIALDEGVRECLSLVATSLTFRGFSVRDEVGAVPASVPKAAIRTLLTAGLLYLTDHNTGPAEVVIEASLRNGALLTLTVRPTDGESGLTVEVPYRRLQWDDLQALAGAELAQIEREGQTFRIALPLAQ